MSDEEKDELDAENEFISLSGVAFQRARERAFKAGLSVMISEDGAIFEVFPNGERHQVKVIEPPVRMPKGFRVTIR